jgi:HAD superfamily hydrolase (TIGR01509 family)
VTDPAHATTRSGRQGGAALRGVLLDIDGTLLDSNAAHAESWRDALAEAGRDVPASRIQPLIGMGGDKLIPIVTGLADDHPDAERLRQRRGEIFRERYLPGLRPTPGAAELVGRLREAGLRLVVATSAGGSELEGLLERAGVPELGQLATTSSDADRSKPDPDIVAAALALAGLRPTEAVMIGDTPYDVDAAARAGVPLVAVRCGGWPDRALAGALAVYDDPADILRGWLQSPFGQVSGG